MIMKICSAGIKGEKMNTACVLLNGDYSFLCTIDVRKAFKLVFANKVNVLKFSDRMIQGVQKAFKIPAVIVLIKVVRSVYRGRVPFSKKNVLIRDRYQCAYCGNRGGNELTIDHVIPKSRGGKTDFDNCVASCRKCNNKKDARTPSEAGVRLMKRPYQPTISEFIKIRLKQSGAYAYLVELGIYS
jgi:5-methylcytosine-specific restriction endonuclease McrA